VKARKKRDHYEDLEIVGRITLFKMVVREIECSGFEYLREW
jgi:hypothetical protein